MAPWDERVPGTPGLVPGQPGAPSSPAPPGLAQLAAILFGRGGQAAPGPGGPVGTPGVVGSAPQQLAPPAPVPGLPSGAPSGPTGLQYQSRAMPASPQMPDNFPNKQARSGAVVKTGIENVSEAIHSFKQQKDQSEMMRAKTTLEMYQKAAAIDPETGQHTDPHMMSVLGNNGQLVRLWEKYITGELPREPATPGDIAIKGKKAQGKPIIPTGPQQDPAAMLKDMIAKKQMEQMRGGKVDPAQMSQNSLPGAEALTPKEYHDAVRASVGLDPKAATAKDTKELEKIEQEIETSKSNMAKIDVEKQKLEAEIAGIPAANRLLRQQRQTELEKLNLMRSEEAKNYREGEKSKTLQQFTIGQRSVKEIVGDASASLSRLQSEFQKSRGKISKFLGSDPPQNVLDEQDRVELLHNFAQRYDESQDDITAGTMTPVEAITKARQDTGLTSEYQPWKGMPKKDSDGKPVPNKPSDVGAVPGQPYLVNGVAVGVASAKGDRWVAP